MPNLKDLKVRIKSVKSTRKITSAMKMVAAAKLRRAQVGAESARPYAARMERMLGSLTASIAAVEGAPQLLAGTGGDKSHLLVLFTADRGLCGSFNASIVREGRKLAAELKAEGKTVKLFCVGRKGREALKREFADDIVEEIQGVGRKAVEFAEAVDIAAKVIGRFEAGEFDVCTMIFNRFQSAMTQILTRQRIIPFTASQGEGGDEADSEEDSGPKASFIFEPDEEDILKVLLPRNIGVQVFQALVESAASEQGARMTAMDNATRNAGEMIDDLTLTYNRTRQAVITRELIEIISGAEAL